MGLWIISEFEWTQLESMAYNNSAFTKKNNNNSVFTSKTIVLQYTVRPTNSYYSNLNAGQNFKQRWY